MSEEHVIVIVGRFAPLAGAFGQLARKNHEAMACFHRFSMAVWTIWLIPYFCGMLTDIPAIDLSANATFGTALAITDAMRAPPYPRVDVRRE